MIDDLATAWGGPAGHGTLRAAPEDFGVDEVLGFEPGDGGEHAWLRVRKRNANTADVAAALAAFAGVPARAVSWSGMKDRRAVARQWFSVHLPGCADPDWRAAGDEHWRVERAVRHGRKLRPGTHRGNRFELRVRALAADPDAVARRLARIASHGFPNYFGAQRFGRGGANLRRARVGLVAGRRRRVGGVQLSAARAWLFNRVLDRRVAEGSWNVAAAGDALMLAGTHSLFEYDGNDPGIPARVAGLDLDVTGPLWGRGELPLGAAAAAREAEWLADEAELCAGLERYGMKAARRALRATAPDLAWELDGDVLVLRFTLASGAFATSLLREVVDTTDAPAAERNPELR